MASAVQSEIAGAIQRRRDAVQAAWDLDQEVVVVGAGDPLPLPGRGDVTYPYRSHSEYFYLTDSPRSGGVLAFDASDGWVDFVRPVSAAERLWEGAPPAELPGPSVDELEAWLTARAGRPLATLGVAPPGLAGEAELTARLRRDLNRVRRPKDAVELARMRVAERATRAGFAAVAELIRPGRTERELQIELEAEFFRRGADALAFDTIVASGPNSAVLHFPPSGRALDRGELVLIDAGGEYRGYASDVTRTFSASGAFTSEQAALYQVVRSALEAGVARCTIQTEFRDVHLTAAGVIAEGLVDFGVLRGSPEALVEQGAVSLFFPHGVGHLVGLGVRDASETRDPRRSADPAIPGLRTDMPLEAGFVTTVEPGVYFVPALFADLDARRRLASAVDWERAEAMLGFGGIRLEHNVLITEHGPEVLTAGIPLSD